MKRFLVLLMIAFLISGGTVGILYQEGVGGLPQESTEETTETTEPTSQTEDELYTQDDLASAQSEEQDIAESYTDSTTGMVTDTEETTDTALEDETTDTGIALEDETTATEEAAAEEAARAEEEAAAKAEAKAAEEAKEAEERKASMAPFYSVTVSGVDNNLNLHSSVSGKNDVIGTVAVGQTGYMIGNDTSGNRLLCYIDGKIAYLSKSYVKYSEIDAADYPDELIGVSADDVGSEIEL